MSFRIFSSYDKEQPVSPDPAEIKYLSFDCPKGEQRSSCSVSGGAIRIKFCPIKPGQGLQKTTDMPDRMWAWDGNFEKPSLMPSINCTGCCLWHGFLTNGQFVGI